MEDALLGPEIPGEPHTALGSMIVSPVTESLLFAEQLDTQWILEDQTALQKGWAGVKGSETVQNGPTFGVNL